MFKNVTNIFIFQRKNEVKEHPCRTRAGAKGQKSKIQDTTLWNFPTGGVYVDVVPIKMQYVSKIEKSM